jgi:hypothetical protein
MEFPLTGKRQGIHPATLLTMLVAAALLISQLVLLARFDLERLFGFSLLDDSFYYFTIARNAASGLGFTFDGLTPTNGFHPLWMLILLLLWPLGGIQAALGAGALFGACTVLLTHLLVSRASGSPWAGTAAAICTAANPALYVVWLNGLETALALLALTLFLWYAARPAAPGGGTRRALTLGLLAGLTTLSRTDYVLLVLPGLLAVVLLERGEAFSARIRRCGIALLPFGLTVAGWVAWSWAHTGTLLQTSGMAIPFINTLSLMDFAGTDSPLLPWARLAKLWEAMTSMRESTGFGWTIALLALALLLQRPAGRRWTERGGRAVPPWLLAGLLVTIIFHTMVRLHLRTWYYAPYALAAGLVFALLLDRLARGGGRRPLRIMAAAALIIAVAIPFGTRWHRLASTGTRTKDYIFFTLRRIMERKADPDAVIGVSDAGYLGYTLPCRVINLDGVVNGDALAAMRQGRLTDYIREMGMSFAFLRGIYFTPRVLGPDFEQWLEIAVFPPRPITFRVLEDRREILQRFRLADRERIDLTLLENRHFLRNFGGDPANFYHEKALYGMGELAELTLFLPPEDIPTLPGAGLRLMVVMALGPDMGQGPLPVEVGWAGKSLTTIKLDHVFRRYQFFLPRDQLSGELQRLSFRPRANSADPQEAFRGRVKSLSFRTLRAAVVGRRPASEAGGNRAVEQR